ncbi:hypothetical protein DYB28_012428 [Aphanomyces astaci]|uniref:F-box domain-containing protein n=1 Tax=Aphanomyces astaci TaxID=112090 RepID=A0A3L6VQL9_APHAT|nr:hypothetical protein DYB34_010586 [Aphanomyces astaci]RLO10979.1 hypothetical protein DYB28_012428 [Aphanomyces astaci]
MSSLNKSFHRSTMHSQSLILTGDDDARLARCGYGQLVPYFHHSRTLRVSLSFALPNELLHLTRFRQLEDVSLVDVASLGDRHLASLTTHAEKLKRLHVDGCHELVCPPLSLPAATQLKFSNNLKLQSLAIESPCTSLSKVHITSCPSFVAFNTLMAAAPNVHTADFTQSNGLVRFHCQLTWQHLRTLVLDRCAQLAYLEVQAPALTSIRVHHCARLYQAILCSDKLRSADFSLLPALQTLYLDCPQLIRLNVTGSYALQSTGVTLECPLLTSNKFHRDGVPAFQAVVFR